MDSPDEADYLPGDNGGGIVIGVVCLVCPLATAAVGLRFYTRRYVLKHVGIDDYLALVSLILAWLTGISQCINTHHGLGAHVWNLSENDIVKYLKNFFVSIVLYNSGLMFVKMTFLAQYYRVLAVERIRVPLMVGMAVVGSWSLAQVVIAIFICRPVAGFWDKSLNPRCIPVPLEWYINSAGNIATDIAVFVLPMPILSHLALPRAEKLVLVCIFSLGFFTCAISVIRMKYLKQGGDFTYENIGGSSWSITELCSGVVCACLPTLRPLVSRWAPSLSRRLHKSSGGCYRRYPDSGSRPSDAGAERGTGYSRHTRDNSGAESHQCPVPLRAVQRSDQRHYPGVLGGAYNSDRGGSGRVVVPGPSSSSRRWETGGEPTYEPIALPPRRQGGGYALRFPTAPSIISAKAICPWAAAESQHKTEIGPSHSPQPDIYLACPNSAICVKHVIVVEESEFERTSRRYGVSSFNTQMSDT